MESPIPLKNLFIKKSVITKCRVCHSDLTHQAWHSQWDSGHHYKTNTCSKCGKKTWLQVDFEGSGHDNWQPEEE